MLRRNSYYMGLLCLTEKINKKRKYKNKKCAMLGCDVVFTPTSGNQKYCDDCKEKAKIIRDKLQWRIQSRKRNGYVRYNRKCLACGTEFTTHYSKKKYCGTIECKRYRKKINSVVIEEKRNKLRKEVRAVKRALVRLDNLKNVELFLNSNNYELLDSSNYINSHRGKLLVKCPNGHEWQTTFHNFKDNKNRCYSCYIKNNYVSKPEQGIRDFIDSNFPDLEVIYNDRTQIYPKELDLYFPDHNLAIEVCGLYWHSDTANGVERNYHYEKMMRCYTKGIRLITIFEDELCNNFGVVTSRIRQALGATNNIIYARKCTIKPIESKEANDFFITSHLQGRSAARKRWGLFYNGRLAGVCSVGNIIRKHTSKEDVLELKRLCFLPGISVVGGASKLFKRAIEFAKEEGYTEIKSYCDMRYTNIFNPIYEILGFSLLTYTKYTPHYFKNGVRYRNMSLRKTPKERLTGKTELELRQAQGYDRIWDCGHRTYTYNIN